MSSEKFKPTSYLLLRKRIHEVGFKPVDLQRASLDSYEGVKPVINLSSDEPTIFELKEGSEGLRELVGQLPKDVKVIDNFSNPVIGHESWAADLYKLEHPTSDLRNPEEQSKMSEYLAKRDSEHDGYWVYRPAWGNRKATLEHLPKSEEFAKILYSRNSEAIEPEVQKKLLDMRVSVAGLSVGSNILETIVRTGIGAGTDGEIRFADRDRTSASNLQRLMGTGTSAVDLPKTESIKQRMWEINPYLNLVEFSDGVSGHNLEEFVIGADAIVEVIDSFPIKHGIRKLASAYGIPVLMPTDLFGKIPVQVEKNLPGETLAEAKYFQGRLISSDLQKLKEGPKSIQEAAIMIIKIIGIENMPTRNLADFKEILDGKKNYFSQPFVPCLISAGATAYYLCEIAKGNLEGLLSEHVVNMEAARGESGQDKKIREEFMMNYGHLFNSSQENTPIVSQESVPEVSSVRPILRDGIKMLLTEHKDSTRKLEFKIGPMQLEIEEAPAKILHKNHPFWKKIQQARESYRNYWFDSFDGDGVDGQVDEDIFDGIAVKDSPFSTYHYVATITTPSHQKVLTMRKLYYPSLKDVSENLLPDDVAFWEVSNPRGERKSLRDTLLWINQKKYPSGNLSISTISRTGTKDISFNPDVPKEQGGSGLAFAGMQILACMDKDVGNLILCTLCDEFKEVVLAVNNGNGDSIQPAFTRTDKILNLGKGFEIKLNSGLKSVRDLKAKAGGYFVDQPGAFKESILALQEQEINSDDVLKITRRIFGSTTHARLIKDLQAVGIENETIRTLENKVSKVKNGEDFHPDIEVLKKMIALMVLPKNAKYLWQLYKEKPRYLERILTAAGDGPYSSTLIPHDWSESAWIILEAAQQRYGKNHQDEVKRIS